MTAADLRHRIAALGYSQRGFAAFVGANERTVRRWAEGEQDIPQWVGVMLDLLEATHHVLHGADGALRTAGFELDPTAATAMRNGLMGVVKLARKALREDNTRA